MIKYIFTRTLAMIPTFLLLTMFGFLLMELPPGDYVTSYIRAQAAQGNTSAADQEDSMRAQYGLDQPLVVRYGLWLSRFVRGDFGDSFEFRRPATEIIGNRLGPYADHFDPGLFDLLGHRHPAGHLFGYPPVFACGQFPDDCDLCGPGDP